MPCYSPLRGYRGVENPVTGKRPLVIVGRSYVGPEEFLETVPCGKCIGCRLRDSREKSIRCMHEASLHEHNCFVTLTYSDEHMPPAASLQLKHVQDFMKRLRKKFGAGVRVYYCGEYGEKFLRPHYHLCLFNIDFHDKILHQRSYTGHNLYRSPTLEKIWKFGYSSIGSLTFDSAAYTARYIMKKRLGPDSKSFYASHTDLESGEVVYRVPEFNKMSNRPGIAKLWFDKHRDDVYSYDGVVFKAHKVPPPRYYDSQFELLYPNEMALIKHCRKERLEEYKLTHPEEFKHPRLKTKRLKKELDITRLYRNLE